MDDSMIDFFPDWDMLFDLEAPIEREVEEDLTDEDEGARLYHLNSRFAYVMWSKSRIDDKEKFYGELKDAMLDGTKIYGGRELHEDGTSHYHVIIRFSTRINWTDARSKFTLPDDTDAIRIVKPKLRQLIKIFLDRTQRYCEKDNNTFGERLFTESEAKLERKRVHDEIFLIKDYDKAKEMIARYDSYKYIHNSMNIASYLTTYTKRARKDSVKTLTYVPLPYILPQSILDWKRDNIDTIPEGRPTSLIIIGKSKIGKTKWVESFGTPVMMTKKWTPEKLHEDMTHLVVNDVKANKFGYQDDSYWREVLGCQEEFEFRDFQKPVETCKFNKLTV